MADQEHSNYVVPVQDGPGMEICNANCAYATRWIVPLRLVHNRTLETASISVQRLNRLDLILLQHCTITQRCLECHIVNQPLVSFSSSPNASPSHSLFSRPGNGGWAHISCAIWIPEVRVANVERMGPITSTESIPVSQAHFPSTI